MQDYPVLPRSRRAKGIADSDDEDQDGEATKQVEAHDDDDDDEGRGGDDGSEEVPILESEDVAGVGI